MQVRAFDAARGGAKVGVATLIALCSGLLSKPVRGGLALVATIHQIPSNAVRNALLLAIFALTALELSPERLSALRGVGLLVSNSLAQLHEAKRQAEAAAPELGLCVKSAFSALGGSAASYQY